MAERTQRLIDGPDKDLLELQEVADYLRLSAATVKRLIDLGEFPRPIRVSDRTRVWDWKDVVYWKLRSEMRPRLKVAKERKKQSGDQGRTTDDHRSSNSKRARPDA